MEKRRLQLDREVVTAMQPSDDSRREQGVDAASIPTTPTSVWSIIISILSVVTLPPKTDPSGEF